MYSGGSRGGRPSPYFWTKQRPKGLKKIFWDTTLPSLFKGLDHQAPPLLISRSGSGTAVAGKMAILLLRIQGKSQGYGECLPTVLDFSDKWKLKIVDICDCSGWSGRIKSGESGTCLFSQLLQWSAVIPNICKLKFVLSGMLGINDWLCLQGPNPPTAWHGSSPLKNQQNDIWDRLLDSPDMSAKSRLINHYNRFFQHKKPGLMEVTQHYRDFVWKNIIED